MYTHNTICFHDKVKLHHHDSLNAFMEFGSINPCRQSFTEDHYESVLIALIYICTFLFVYLTVIFCPNKGVHGKRLDATLWRNADWRTNCIDSSPLPWRRPDGKVMLYCCIVSMLLHCCIVVALLYCWIIVLL